MLYKAGIPITYVAQFSAEATGNVVFAGWVRGAAESAQAGHPLSDGFSRELPREFRDAWQVGEESGMLDEAASRLADNAADAARRRLTHLCIWLPRIVYFLVCAMMVKMIFKGYSQIPGAGF